LRNACRAAVRRAIRRAIRRAVRRAVRRPLGPAIRRIGPRAFGRAHALALARTPGVACVPPACRLLPA
jgi:hypothetical protein